MEKGCGLWVNGSVMSRRYFRQCMIWCTILLSACLILLAGGASFALAGDKKPKTTAFPKPKIPESYIIGPSDILEVTVWREDSLSRTDVLVRPDGRISMPLLDDVLAAGRTPMQLKLILTKKLKKYVEAPKVYITVQNPRSHYFSVLGNVMKPGRYEMLTPTSVLEALAQAEGFNEWADKDEVVVLRGKGDEQQRMEFDYPAVVKGEKMEQNIVLQPGDVIIVP